MGCRRVISVIASLLVLGACAATTPNAKPQAAALGSAGQDSACLKQTGGRLPDADSGCAGYGRSFSRDDINHTGAQTAGDAMRLLDPSITVSR